MPLGSVRTLLRTTRLWCRRAWAWVQARATWRARNMFLLLLLVVMVMCLGWMGLRNRPLYEQCCSFIIMFANIGRYWGRLRSSLVLLNIMLGEGYCPLYSVHHSIEWY